MRPSEDAQQLCAAVLEADARRVRNLLDAGVPAGGGTDGDGWTPLTFAARCGQADIVRLLLVAGADPGERNGFGETPREAGQVHAPVVRLLEENGAAPDPTLPPPQAHALIRAIDEGDANTVRRLVAAGQDLNASYPAPYSWPPLLRAAMSPFPPMVSLLLELGADPDKADQPELFGDIGIKDVGPWGLRQLLLELRDRFLDAGLPKCAAAVEEWRQAVLTGAWGDVPDDEDDEEDSFFEEEPAGWLDGEPPEPAEWACDGEILDEESATGEEWDSTDDEPADVEWTDSFPFPGGGYVYQPPLHRAVCEGNFPRVLELLHAAQERGAGPDARDGSGHTALVRAVASGSPEMADLLLSHGASPDVPDTLGRTPLHHAVWRGVYRSLEIGPLESARLLLDAGADPNAAAFDGWTPLHQAAYRGFTGTVRALLDAGAVPDPADRDGWTPLMWAARMGHASTATLLVGRGADPRRTDADGRDAFSHAAPYPEVTTILQNGG